MEVTGTGTNFDAYWKLTFVMAVVVGVTDNSEKKSIFMGNK